MLCHYGICIGKNNGCGQVSSSQFARPAASPTPKWAPVPQIQSAPLYKLCCYRYSPKFLQLAIPHLAVQGYRSDLDMLEHGQYQFAMLPVARF